MTLVSLVARPGKTLDDGTPGSRSAVEGVAGGVAGVAGQQVGIGEDENGPVGVKVGENLGDVATPFFHAHVTLRGRLKALVDPLAVLVEDPGVEGLVRVAGVHAQGRGRVEEVEAEPESGETTPLEIFFKVQ